ncbi:MAG: hypothetical protein V1245_02470 [Arenicellales bacterium]|jgi:hypothetical protein|nr:hypothetical protein [Arenicellales bacterium]MDP6854050.1 hypothetical protein [Arenicellales bacterium]MDP6948667.1 hypothetical protein [Arenicellales bacterium]MDP7564229.1 hypothetical protein [Arenicellales bacterium]MEE1558245.1 hypothetical protein [Arenicellales bacterium]|tara:strand:+ start:1787 stop:1915 length:129 start_codon:yes stop_codon:yes gene_type:complete
MKAITPATFVCDDLDNQASSRYQQKTRTSLRLERVIRVVYSL